MQQLSAIDSLFLHVERGNAYMHIGPVMLYEPPRAERGKFRIEAVLDVLRQRLQQSAAFRQRLLSVPGNLDNPYWVEDQNFDVSRHITRTRLAAPGDRRQFELASLCGRQRLRVVLARPARQCVALTDLEPQLAGITRVDG